MLPETRQRVRLHTDRRINAQVDQRIEDNVQRYGRDRNTIERRLKALDREWDIERALEANAASLALLGLSLGLMVDRRWFILPVAVAGFLLQHATQGWCPPVPVLRRLGFRTEGEIGEERAALKAMRGDFTRIGQAVAPDIRATEAVYAARL